MAKNTKSRVVGSGNTLLYDQNGKEIAFLTSVSETPPAPLGDAKVIQGLGSLTPDEIVTGNAVGEGTIVLSLVETWDEEAWQRLAGYASAKSIGGTYGNDSVLGANPLGGFTLKKLIKGPNSTRSKVYTGCVITGIDESEQYDVRAMTRDVKVTIKYTKATTV